MDYETLMQQLGAFGQARSALDAWIAGAHALGVLRAALTVGLIDALRTPQTPAHVATATQLSEERVTLLCEALDALGVLVRENSTYRLANNWLVLAAPDALMRLEDTVDGALARGRLLEVTGSSDDTYWTLSSQQRVALARAITINPSAALLPDLAAYMIGSQAPEVDALLRGGGRYLELGCGVGGGLLSLIQVYPAMTAVGVDIAGDVLAEAQQRVDARGVGDRVELRRQNAADIDAQQEFDIVFWSQFFFPSPSRAPTLRAALRALKPGGFFMAPLLADPPASPEALHSPPGQAYALDRIVYGTWNVPVLSAHALESEVTAAGFEYLRISANELGTTLLARRPG